MTAAYQRLYKAQVKEHEKTHDRLRTVEKENKVIRGLLLEAQKEVNSLRKFLNGLSNKIEKELVGYEETH